MRIKQILSQHRRDFQAIFVCEHCGWELERRGYDDKNFHDRVIPSIRCQECGQKAADDYMPLAPKYPEGFQI